MEASSSAKFTVEVSSAAVARIKTRGRRVADTLHCLFSCCATPADDTNSTDDQKSTTKPNYVPTTTDETPSITMKITIALVLCLAAIATAAPYVPVAVVPVIPTVVHHPASVVHSSTVVQSHPSPLVSRVVAVPAIAHPVAYRPAAVSVHPVAVHPVAVHPIVPVHAVAHY